MEQIGEGVPLSSVVSFCVNSRLEVCHMDFYIAHDRANRCGDRVAIAIFKQPGPDTVLL